MTYLDRSHPIRALLEQAALSGKAPTEGQLDQLLKGHDLPPGEDLNRRRASIYAAAQRVAAARSQGYAAAREVSDDSWPQLAKWLTEAEAAISGEANPEPLDSITRRMFSH